ncbi:MAG: gliding motility protein GldL [Clostridiales bacterium]|nr:gliding motility protein GldL [Clostridiales bacterium]
MGKIKRYRNVISRFISSENGQRFFNFAYSIGAAIVIWGALFKILHLPGGNALLSIGMGTEVLMFILTAFDRPPKEYKWERVYPSLESAEEKAERESVEAEEALRNNIGTGTVVPTGNRAAVVVGNTSASDIAAPTTALADRMQSISDEMEQLRDLTHRLNQVSSTLLESYRAITENSDNIAANSAGYVDQMQTLNRNIQGLNTIYEIQLKSVSSQLDAIDRVNRGIKEISDMYAATAGNSQRYCAETEKMAENMKRLNSVYEKVLTAMTINMYPGMTAPAATTPPPTPSRAGSDNK